MNFLDLFTLTLAAFPRPQMVQSQPLPVLPASTFGTCNNFFGTKGDSSDCSIYYSCWSGFWKRNQCLQGFHWNKISQSCDFAWHAGCVVGDPEQGIEPPTFGPCTGWGLTGDSSDCTIYYQCLFGQWNRRQCLVGFHWNTIMQSCDFISHAKCNKSG